MIISLYLFNFHIKLAPEIIIEREIAYDPYFVAETNFELYVFFCSSMNL